MSPAELLRLRVRGESDVFLLRQRGREVAAAVGLDTQNQIRVATSLSDLGRDLLTGDIWVSVEFRLDTTPSRPALRIQLHWQGGDPIPEGRTGWVTATRLMSGVHADRQGEHHVLSLHKDLPPAVVPPTAATLRSQLAKLAPASALDELRAQNEDLVATLDALETKQAELLRLNAELEETNRGVLALYNELTDELDKTNQGVVALYAELDTKSTQLKEASAAKTRFWANVSHELRTPINSVVGLAGLLLGMAADPLTEEQRHQIQMINDSGRTLLALVNELLDAAKAESGRLRPHLAPVDLPALFDHLRGTLLPTGDVSLRIDAPPADLLLVTDETMLIRILRNLLSNALKFTEHGEVRLTANADAAHCAFFVRDTGIGIPAGEQQRVFEEFHQVPNPLQARTGGTGLGLPYARKLTEILAGTLELRSTPGEGTEVVLRLPATGVEPQPLGRVLLVDDDDTFRARLRSMIDPFAAAVHEAADGRAAVRTAVADPTDLIFLDLNMPELDGYACLAALRGEPALRQVPVVVVTSVDDAGIDHAALGPGVAVLPKSGLSPAGLQDGVRRARQATRQQGDR